jgi:Domain of unknown function (DUF5666)
MKLRMMTGKTGWARLASIAAALGLAAGLLSGCSSNVTSDLANNIAGPAVAVPVLITDAPSDQLVAFSLTLNSIVLTDSAGKTTNVLSTPTTVEICHLNGIQEALVTANIPQDTYVSALITFSNPQITYINSSGQPVVASPTLTATSYTATFTSPITINSTSTSLLFDLLASQSVTISGTTVTVSPVFSVKAVPAATAVPPSGRNGTGMEQHGTVVSVSGTTLVVQPGSGANITLTTNSSTVLQGFSALSSLTAGEQVEVDFTVQTGGVLLATRIELEPTNPGGQAANQLTGPVTAVTAGSGFKMTLMRGQGPAINPTSAGTVYTVTTTSATVYAITPQFVSLAGLPFTPTFTAATLKPGQTVSVTASAISTTAATATATNVYLVPQTLNGTVTAISTSGSYTAYTLSLASGSAFTSLSGASTVTVYTSTATASTSSTAIAVGSQLRFNGLVFSVGSGFSMVAGVCPDGAPGP